MKLKMNWVVAVITGAALAITGCGKKEGGAGGSGQQAGTIQIKGSDTMVNVCQAWAEEYAKVDPSVSVEVAGGGSGVGLAALLKGTIDIAASSRNIKQGEIDQAKKNTGKEPKEFVVGYDALAVYVHKSNPLEEISIEQLAELYREGGTITKWSQLGVTVPGCNNEEIVRVSRQSSSGTYEFFREHVLSKKDFKLGSRDMNGSKEVVELVGTTPCAIGYSGMGYATDHVKMLRITTKKGEAAVAPSVENTMNNSYPIARSLLLYTLGEPEGAVEKFLEWTKSDAGQKLVEQNGYVPLAPDKRTK